MFHFRSVAHVLGLLIAICGVAMMLSIPFSLYFNSGDVKPLLYSGAISIVLGAAIWLLTLRNRAPELKKRDGYMVVTFGWLVMATVGALPYYIAGQLNGPDFPIQTYTDAFFETMAGFTTTGASILGQRIEDLPEGLHFWRAMTHWIGGMGIIVLTIAILPLLGIGGMQLFSAESPGPTTDKLTPRIAETAKRLWAIYVLLTIVEAILLMLGGMNLFESICHAFSTLSTGGFSTRQGSIGAFSPYIQYVVIIFMFAAGTNFALTYWALRGKPIKLWQNEEFRVYLFAVIGLVALVTGVLIFSEDMQVEPAFRAAAFQIVAIITTTGFGTADFTSWGPFLLVLFFVLMFVGACAGSTSGGIKMVRNIVTTKHTYTELYKQVHPNAVVPVRFNKRSVPNEVVNKIISFVLIFVLCFISGTFVMAAMGLDYQTALGAVAATLGNIGPGIGAVGPGDPQNFAAIPLGGKWFLSFLMLLGRLELFTVLMLLTPFYWQKT